MAASASFSFDDGITTSSCMATLPLRIRVSMSAMGSVMVIVVPTRKPMESPGRLGHAGDLARMGHLPEADPAQAEPPVDRLRAAAPVAAGVRPDLELGFALLLLDERLLGHGRYVLSPARRNGKLKASNRAFPSAFVRAVVTIVMFIPRTVSTLS